MFEFPTRDRHPPYVVARIEFKEMTSNRKNDPDGIRTRVAALKGPCPRPLDDGAGPTKDRGPHQRRQGNTAGRESICPDTPLIRQDCHSASGLTSLAWAGDDPYNATSCECSPAALP